MADVTITYVTGADLLRKLGPAYQEAYGQPIPGDIKDVPLVIQFKTKPNGYLTHEGGEIAMTSDSHSETAKWQLIQATADDHPAFFIGDGGALWLTGFPTKSVEMSGAQEPWELITDNVAPGNNLFSVSGNGFAAPFESGLTLVDAPNDANKCFVGVWSPAN